MNSRRSTGSTRRQRLLTRIEARLASEMNVFTVRGLTARISATCLVVRRRGELSLSEGIDPV